MKVIRMKRINGCLGRLVFTALGLTAAILFLTLGFFKTMVIIICCAIGYAIGSAADGKLRIPENFLFWRRKW